MPLHIDTDETDVFSLEDLIDWLKVNQIDTSSTEAMVKAAPALKKLANNREFLASLAVSELKDAYSHDRHIYHYSAQVMLLHLPEKQQDNFYLRANFWPSVKDQPVIAAGPGPFFYNRPHDHNFNFLTVGYFGPGYWSNYYEYNHDRIIGYPGEQIDDLVFTEKRALSEGHIMLYRASCDVHEQLPADSMSISLNVLENSPRVRLTDQYSFDLERKAIKQIINISLAPAVFNIALHLGEGNGEDVLSEIIRLSPDPFIRFNAYKALASRESGAMAYCEGLSAALSDPSEMVSKWARRHIEEVQKATSQPACA
ncbi:MAG: hypothetical protein MRY72_11465 [Aquisalinus sp.]|nr:hypothetical protein [Aquisalinus sp.]